MSYAIYEKYKDITPVADDNAVTTIQLRIMNKTKRDLRKYRIKDSIGGSLYLFSDSDFPDRILEIVPTTIAESNATTLYIWHPIFGSPVALMNARKEMIQAIAAAFLSHPEGIAVHDEGQERDVSLAEHGTAQLIDQMKRMFS